MPVVRKKLKQTIKGVALGSPQESRQDILNLYSDQLCSVGLGMLVDRPRGDHDGQIQTTIREDMANIRQKLERLRQERARQEETLKQLEETKRMLSATLREAEGMAGGGVDRAGDDDDDQADQSEGSGDDELSDDYDSEDEFSGDEEGGIGAPVGGGALSPLVGGGVPGGPGGVLPVGAAAAAGEYSPGGGALEPHFIRNDRERVMYVKELAKEQARLR